MRQNRASKNRPTILAPYNTIVLREFWCVQDKGCCQRWTPGCCVWRFPCFL